MYHLKETAISGLFADPDIAIFNGRYYIYPTTDGFDGWSGTQFFVFSSADGKHFEKECLILDVASSQVPWAAGSAWAPCIATKGGKYYFYFCAKRPDGVSCIGVAVADHPTGPFSSCETPLITPELMKAHGISICQTIDPSIYTEGENTYLLFGNGNPVIVELSEDMLQIKAETMRNIEGAFDFREAITVLKRGDMYHFTWSCDDTGSENYHINYGISKSLYGPIEYQYPVLEKQNGSFGTGHHSIVKLPDKDSYIIAFHRFGTPLEKYPSGKGFYREICTEHLYFDENGKMKPVILTNE